MRKHRMFIGDNNTEIDIDWLKADLKMDGYEIAHISVYGELTITDGKRNEIWIAREVGCGTNNTSWGDAPNGYEFCSSSELNITD